MEVELGRNLLAPPREDLTLLALCAFGLSGRHSVVPDDRNAWSGWVTSFPADLCEEIRLAWDESERRIATGVPRERVCVLPRGPSSFRGSATLTPTEAFLLLSRPLRVFLENGRNDRSFVMAFANATTRVALEESEKHGWLVFETVGGIGELRIRLAAAGESPEREVFRTFYLCDSDALEPNQPSHDAVAVRTSLAELSTRHGQSSGHFGGVLARRAAENYAPPSAVLKWASGKFGPHAGKTIQQTTTPAGRAALAEMGTPASARRHLLAAIALRELMSKPDVLGHIDMKFGRSNGGSVRTIDAIWTQLDAFQQAALVDGFGRAFSGDFFGAQSGLQDPSGELGPLIATMLRRL